MMPIPIEPLLPGRRAERISGKLGNEKIREQKKTLDETPRKCGREQMMLTRMV